MCDACPAETGNIIPIGRDGSMSLKPDGDNFLLPEKLESSLERKFSEAGPRKGKEWMPTPIAAADAIRKAGELRDDVEGIRPFDGVMLWSEDGSVTQLDVHWHEDEDDPLDVRYASAWTTMDDFIVITEEEARTEAQADTYVHIGQVPVDLLKPRSGSAVPGTNAEQEIPRRYGPSFLYTLIEFCCSSESKLCSPKYLVPGVRLVRIDLSHDVTTKEGLEYARSFVRDPLSGHVIVMSSMPCTRGCTLQRINEGRKCMDDPQVYYQYQALQVQHEKLLDGLFRALDAICDDLLEVGGDLCHEWGARNALWGDERMQRIIRKMGMSRVLFDGCALGLRARNGKYIKKPWLFYTTIPQIAKKFSKARCSCPPGSHACCNSANAALSAFYTWKMTDWLHDAFRLRVSEVSSNYLPSIESVLESKVKMLASSPGWHPLDESWVHIQPKALRPKALVKSAKSKDWPRRTTLALMDSTDDCSNDWICLEEDYDHRKPLPCQQYLFEPTTVATIYHPSDCPGIGAQDLRTTYVTGSAAQCANLDASLIKTDDLSQEQSDTPISIVDPSFSAASGHEWEECDQTKPKKWVATWSINQDDEISQCSDSEVLKLNEDTKLKIDAPTIDWDDEARFVDAAAGEPGMLEAMSVANRWIMDTGCGKDLIGLKLASQFHRYQKDVDAFTFNTANKSVNATKCLPIQVSALETSYEGTEESEPYVMPHCPAVLSVGLRVMNQGFSYIWLAGKTPALVTPDLRIIPLDVLGDIPYLKADGLHTEYCDRSEIAALTGVTVDENNQLMLTSEYLGAFMDSVAAEPDGVDRPGKEPKGKKVASSVVPDTEGEGSTEAPDSDASELEELETDEDEQDWYNSGTVRESLQQRADSAKHKLTHKPALSHNCEACLIGKTRALRKVKGKSTRQTKRYGDIWSMDHCYMRDWYQQPGVGGFPDFLSVKDRHTGRTFCCPTESKDTDETYDTLNNLRGDDRVRRIYCDGFKSFKKAIKRLGVMHEPSQPGIHETNAIIERANGDILSGLRTSQVEAGHPGCMWPWSGPCYTFLESIGCDDDQEESSYKKHTGQDFDGIALPYGCGVFFKPAPTKYALSKAAPRMQYGVLLGYRLAPGGRWSGEYIVADLDDFVGKDFSIDADPMEWSSIKPHITKVIKLGKRGVTFPCKQKYDRVNTTLEGREEAHKLYDPVALGVDTEERKEDLKDELFGVAEEAARAEEEEGSVAPDAGAQADPAPYGYYTDSLGRKYPLDMFGQRLRKGSRRPPYYPVDEWAKLSEKKKKAEYKRWKEGDHSDCPALAPPAAPAESVTEDDKKAWDERYSRQWSDIDAGVQDFERDWHTPTITVDDGDEADAEAVPAVPRAVKRKKLSQRDRKKARLRMQTGAFEAPAMPCETTDTRTHRPKHSIPLFPACVAAPVPRKDILKYPKAIAAREKEANKLTEKRVWWLETVQEWSDVAATAREKNEEIHIGRVFGIMVIKNSELAEEFRKFKYRLVFSGDRVVNQSWEKALFQDLGSSPASMESGKCVDMHGSTPGHVVQQADAEQAYIQADLKGPTTWVLLPEELWPDSWYVSAADGTRVPKYHRPVVQLKKALYGHPDAGTYWEMHLNQRLKQIGFQSLPSWPSCYWQPSLGVYLSVYVDDFKMSGPPKAVATAWAKIKEHVEMEDPQGLDLYLGCKHKQSIIKLKDGKSVNVVEYDMEEPLKAAVDKYIELASALEGKPVKLKYAPTPCIAEDQKTSPMGAPAYTGKGTSVQCPWCQHVFPGKCDGGSAVPGTEACSAVPGTVDGNSPADSSGQNALKTKVKLKTLKKSKLKSKPQTEPATSGGTLQSIAASILMKVL